MIWHFDTPLNEASSLTPEEKMQAWHYGDRKENIKACGDAKLQLYYDICMRKGYIREAKAILEEAKNRGLSWAIKAATVNNMYAGNTKSVAQYLKDLAFSAKDFDLATATFVKQNENNYLDLATDAFGATGVPVDERLKCFVIYIIFALVFGNTKLAGELKDILPHDTTTVNTLKEVITNIISDKVLMSTLSDVKKEILSESLQEKIEKHDNLNPKLFDENKHLYPEVREKLLQIADEFIKGIKEDEVKFNLKDIKIVGSNCSYNYNPDSDLDLHLVAETKSLACPDDLYPIIYNLYKSAWNNAFEPKIKGIPVELYVETEVSEEKPVEEAISANPLVSNGAYSVLDDKWIKEPVITEIPEVNQKEVDDALAPWLLRYNEITKEPSIEAIEEFMDDLYKARQTSIMKEGEYNPTNHAFKALRAAGQLDELRELKRSLKEKELSLESLKEDINKIQPWVEQQMEELFNDWVGLALDDLDELESYGFVEGEEKDYARARMAELAEDPKLIEDIIERMHDWEGYSPEFKDEALTAAIKEYLKDRGYLAECLKEELYKITTVNGIETVNGKKLSDEYFANQSDVKYFGWAITDAASGLSIVTKLPTFKACKDYLANLSDEEKAKIAKLKETDKYKKQCELLKNAPLNEDIEKEIQISDNKNIEDDAKELNPPISLDYFVNNLGINLNSVKSEKWTLTDDEQLKKLEVEFIPAEKEEAFELDFPEAE